MECVSASPKDGIDWLFSLTREELMAIEGVGAKTADSVIAWYSIPENRELIRRLRKAGAFGGCK